MKTVQQKIRDTVLFIPEEKVEILVAFESFSQLDREQLEDIIDEYDKEYQNITKKFKDAMFQELEKIQNNSSSEDKSRLEAAVDQIKLGLQTILPDIK